MRQQIGQKVVIVHDFPAESVNEKKNFNAFMFHGHQLWQSPVAGQFAELVRGFSVSQLIRRK